MNTKQTWKKITDDNGKVRYIPVHEPRTYRRPKHNGGESVCLECGVPKNVRRLPKEKPSRVDETVHTSGCSHPGYGTEEVPYLWTQK